MDVGVKESSKLRTIDGLSCRKMEEEKLAESRCPECGGVMEVRKIEIAMGDCIKSDLERGGEE